MCPLWFNWEKTTYLLSRITFIYIKQIIEDRISFICSVVCRNPMNYRKGPLAAFSLLNDPTHPTHPTPPHPTCSFFNLLFVSNSNTRQAVLLLLLLALPTSLDRIVLIRYHWKTGKIVGHVDGSSTVHYLATYQSNLELLLVEDDNDTCEVMNFWSPTILNGLESMVNDQSNQISWSVKGVRRFMMIRFYLVYLLFFKHHFVCAGIISHVKSQ